LLSSIAIKQPCCRVPSFISAGIISAGQEQFMAFPVNKKAQLSLRSWCFVSRPEMPLLPFFHPPSRQVGALRTVSAVPWRYETGA